MNFDAALVFQALVRERVPRQARSLAKVTGLPIWRVRAAIDILRADHKIEPSLGGAWSLVKP